MTALGEEGEGGGSSRRMGFTNMFQYDSDVNWIFDLPSIEIIVCEYAYIRRCYGFVA